MGRNIRVHLVNAIIHRGFMVDSDSIGDKQKEVVNGEIISEEKERYSRGEVVPEI